MLLNYVMGAMFIVLPLFWMSVMTWVGIRAAGVLGGLTTGTNNARTAGSKGSDLLIKAAKQTD
jgi:hypothetical protein